MDRALVFGTRGWGFESLRVHTTSLISMSYEVHGTALVS